MRRLGYDRYVAQGGDVGAGVTDAMGRLGPKGLVGIHTNLLVPALNDPASLPHDSDAERAALTAIKTFQTSGNGYFVEMATRPQTIGYALLDPPSALAAWMIDHDTDAYYKIARTFVDGQPSGNLTRDHILDNVTAYWLTGTGASAARSYWEAYGPDAPSAGQPAAPAAPDPGRLQHVPGRDLAHAAQLGREVLPPAQLLRRGRTGWPLRCLGGAGAVRGRAPGRVPSAAGTAGPAARSLTYQIWSPTGGQACWPSCHHSLGVTSTAWPARGIRTPRSSGSPSWSCSTRQPRRGYRGSARPLPAGRSYAWAASASRPVRRGPG